MQYNLLNYGNYFGDCTTSSNNVNSKNAHLRNIIDYVKPDIFTVNELSDDISYHQMILNQVLNIDGENKYRKAVSFNYADSYIVNMLYYNSEKLALYKQDVVLASYRDIDAYTLYYKAADLAQTRDTIFLTCFVAHLKAGNSESDATSRAGMVANVISYIRTHDLSENLLFMGDFNLYTSSEQAYINMTYTYNGIRYFYDPLNREGNWNNNSSFSDVHTQSTHGNNVDCFSSGGLDDRFDFIMATEAVLEGSHGIKMVPGSYQALGNDNQHFNKSITDDPLNTSAPSDIIEALYGMSDHLPVLTKLEFDAALGLDDQNSNITAIRFANPNSGHFSFEIALEKPDQITIEIFDLFGRPHFYRSYPKKQIFISDQLNIDYLASGTYLLVVSDEEGNRNTKKFFIKK
jgi:endonuclease/exonuclease/phosphatase family metal-dependent hydrolase